MPPGRADGALGGTAIRSCACACTLTAAGGGVRAFAAVRRAVLRRWGSGWSRRGRSLVVLSRGRRCGVAVGRRLSMPAVGSRGRGRGQERSAQRGCRERGGSSPDRRSVRIIHVACLHLRSEKLQTRGQQRTSDRREDGIHSRRRVHPAIGTSCADREPDRLVTPGSRYKVDPRRTSASRHLSAKDDRARMRIAQGVSG